MLNNWHLRVGNQFGVRFISFKQKRIKRIVKFVRLSTSRYIEILLGASLLTNTVKNKIEPREESVLYSLEQLLADVEKYNEDSSTTIPKGSRI
ncbi:MAG: hypothetical protein DRR19_00345 [Candidatus Parabeggiatoa sp. nov. 1]|nr:MAG: hypothetical protein DRR19_00345 [Gammaproteobacteria bacterium]